MSQTIVGVNDAKAVKRFSPALAVDAARKGQWTRKWMAKGPTATRPIHGLSDLEGEKGEQISFDISMQLNAQPIEGDDEARGKGEKLFFYSQVVYIDQSREIVSPGGRMTQKRTLHDLRMVAKARTSDLWGRIFDQVIFVYLSGARGVNADYVYPTTWTGRANNSLSAPDSNHIVYGGVATGKTDMQTTDTMTTLPIDKAVAYAKMMGGGGPAYSEVPQIQPINLDGEEVFLLVMNPWQEFNLRRNTTSMDWADIQKAMAMATGRNNEFMKGGLGMWNKVVLQVHQNVIQFSDYGATTNVAACRALFCGVQAGTLAQGQAGGDLTFGWFEEMYDGGNQVDIYTDTKYGFIKTNFNGNDFGVIAIDTAAAKP
jgi:N4-gp56 family major capsid protein